MPFKDVNFKKLAEAEEVNHRLKTKIAVIDKLNDRGLSMQDKLPTIELITGKKYQPKVNPI